SESLRLKQYGKLLELYLSNLLWPDRAKAILLNYFSLQNVDRREYSMGGIRSFASGVLATSFRRIRRRMKNYVVGRPRA
ncbi:MAG: hypothetical protein ACREEP_15205, partial [Dongiaceae bacterium]